jgi:hypothetical protein
MKGTSLPSPFRTKAEAIDEMLVLLTARVPSPAPAPLRERRACAACSKPIVHVGDKAGRHKCSPQ